MWKPAGLGSGRESRRDDATGLANGKETVPAVRSNNTATVGSEETGFEIERTEEMALGVGEWDGGGPGDELGRVRGSIRRNKLDGAKFHDTVERTEREAIPLRPPTTQRVAHRRVRWMLKQKLDMVYSRSVGVNAVRVEIG
jgi:hypothetical protein